MADLARKLEEEAHFRELDPSPMEWTGVLAILATLSIGLFTSCFFMLLEFLELSEGLLRISTFITGPR